MNLFSQGDRLYIVGNSTVRLNSEQIRKKKSMVKLDAFDSTFVSALLDSVFDTDVLKISSAGGRKSNFNRLSHIALDPVILKFVEGIMCFK